MDDDVKYTDVQFWTAMLFAHEKGLERAKLGLEEAIKKEAAQKDNL